MNGWPAARTSSQRMSSTRTKTMLGGRSAWAAPAADAGADDTAAHPSIADSSRRRAQALHCTHMDRLFADITYGLRMLVRYPTLSLGAIVTLGVGIGLSTTVFCVVNAGMLKGLPLPNADRIVAVFALNSSQG